jgi:tetratricopeptide (TPR) repeat protein
MKKRTCFVMAWAALFAGTQTAQSNPEYRGAATVLKELEALANVAPDKKEDDADAVSILLKQIERYRDQSKTLSAEQAASGWMELYDTYVSIPTSLLYGQQGAGERLSLQSLISSLPPTSAWKALAAQIEQRNADGKDLKSAALNLFVAVLNGDTEVRKKAIDAVESTLKSKAGMDDYLKNHLQDFLWRLSNQPVTSAGSNEEKLAQFEKMLKAFESKDERLMERYGVIIVPDLAKLTDRGKAEAYLLRVFKLQKDFFIGDNETRSLASQLALTHMDLISKPLWDLVAGPDDAKLFEALVAKFPDVDVRQYARTAAEEKYLVSLIIQDRTEEASKMMLKMIESSQDGTVSISGKLNQMQQKGYGKQVHAFLRSMLKKDPALLLWSDYIELSAQMSVAPEALEFLEKTLVKAELGERARSIAEPFYYRALLAADQIEEGVKILQKLVAAGPQKLDKAMAEERNKKFETLGLSADEVMKIERTGQQNAFRKYQEECGQLVTIGRLMKRPEWVAEGLQQAVKQLNGLSAAELIEMSEPSQLIVLLVEADRGHEAEALVVKRLAAKVESQKGQRNGYSHHSGGADDLTSLAWIYSKAGRHADVLELLDKSPMWGAPDLLHLSSGNIGGTRLGKMAAEALLQAGRKQEAEVIVSSMVENSPGADDGYQLLLQLHGKQTIERLDQLVQGDAFQERPLIWKAILQFDAGDLAGAEKTVRAAIAIDPSDGEQGKGDRMRAYAVLGDILEKKGDGEQAKIMRGAVSAIRLSEDADDWWTAGLLTRAVEMYEKSLLHFADAYCIQSRLALRYSELGEFEKAEQHYRRAYELMPDSFGRIESHCFGCEGAFRGERAQGVAERVFTKLAAEHPEKAQVFYLLGYLRESQGRSAEAVDHYRQAVKLDADYLNAYKKLIALAGTVDMPTEERDTLSLELFRLDPFGKHSGSGVFEDMSDLKRLWDALLTAQDKLPAAPPTSLYRLAASREALQKQHPDLDVDTYYRGPASPRERFLGQFSSHSLVSAPHNFWSYC